jgi:hypothetical protein
MEVAAIIMILEFGAKYGIPAVKEAIQEMNKEKITQEDIDKLPSLIKRPEEY